MGKKTLSTELACEIIRALPGISEKDHFGSDGFYANKRIFATVWHGKDEVNIRLTPSEQKKFIDMNGEAFSEVPNAFGRQGWTTVHLHSVERDLFVAAITSGWQASVIKATRRQSSGKVAKPAPKRKAPSKAKKAQPHD